MRYFIIFGIVTFNGELNKPDFYNKLNYFSACKELGFLSLSIAKGGGGGPFLGREVDDAQKSSVS